MIKREGYRYRDKTLFNKILKLTIICTLSIVIRYIFNKANLETSDFVFSIIFGIFFWVLLIVQRKI